jgi:hypothetical protein
MKAFVNALVLASALALPLTAQGSDQDGADRWVPSIAGVSGITAQDWDADVSSIVCRGCTIPDPLGREVELRVPANGDDRDITPYVGASLELMTPELPVPGSPRLFAGAEILGAFGIERKIARQGQPGTVRSPAPEGAQENTSFDAEVALGQGGRTVATMSDVMYGIYAGVSFPFDLNGRAIRIRPGLAWIRYEIDLEGLVVDADCQPQLGRTECNTNLAGFLRETRLPGSATETFDGIGPALDVEMDTGRLGPLGTSLFLGTRVYRILGDTDVDFRSGPITISDQLGTDDAAARFGFEVDDWMYRVGIGMRLQWLGQDD